MTQMDLFEPKLNPKQRELIARAAALLTNLGCKYYIKTVDGETFSLGMKPATSEAEPATTVLPPKPKRVNKYPHGARAQYVKPYIDKITTPGDMVTIPGNGVFTLKEIAHAASTLAHTKLGKGMYQVEVDATNNEVTVVNNGGIRV